MVIDDRIATIEFKLNTESISLKEEKKYLLELQELKRNRPKVSKVNNLKESFTAHKEGVSGNMAEMKATIQEINAAMAKHREEKKVIQEKLGKIRDERKEKLGDVPAWVDERNQIGEKVQEKIKEKNALRDEFKAKERDQANLYKKAEKLEDQPYVAEITLIEQTIAFCESLTKKKAEAEEQEKKEVEHGDTKGLEVLMKKEDRDEEYYYAPTAKGKKSKGKKGANGKPIKHNAETFRLFDQLKLNA